MLFIGILGCALWLEIVLHGGEFPPSFVYSFALFGLLACGSAWGAVNEYQA